MADILFKTDSYVFSYRVSGICIQNGKLLLQKPTNDNGFAFPGGHVEFGETNQETLMREFKEEIGADISVGDLKWVGEVFFTWGSKPCHQICLYYIITIENDNIPKDGIFTSQENTEIEFHWISLDELRHFEIYPTNATQLLDNINEGTQHFIYRE